MNYLTVIKANIFIDVSNFIVNYVSGMSNAEIYSAVIIISFAFLFIILERAFPYTKGQKIFRNGFIDDLALYSIAQSYILGIIIFGFIIRFIDNSTGISRLSLFEDVPIMTSIIIFSGYTRFLHLLDAPLAA